VSLSETNYAPLAFLLPSLFSGEGKRISVLKLPEQTIYSSNDILTPEVLDHIEMVVMSRLVHAITTCRTG
jgi:hypothetical protein